MDQATFSAAIGARLRDIRRGRGPSQDQLVRTLRGLGGPSWNRSTVAKIEGGTRELSLEEALLVCAALGARLADLAPENEILMGETPVSAAAVKDVLAGGSAGERLFEELARPKIRKTMNQFQGRLRALYGPHEAECQRLYGGPVPGRVVIDAITDSTGEAERKAADRLKVDPLVLAVGARRLWDRSLSEERDERVSDYITEDASPRTVQALRGHTTRQLVEELAQLLTDGMNES
jgi:transcriptional regulator with XRE-family HTH domain